MSKYDYLSTMNEGEENVEIELSIKNFRPMSGGSGHVPAGFYEMLVTGGRIEAKKGGKTGRNIHWTYEVAGPDRWAKVPVHQYMPAPTDGGAKDTGYTQLQSLVWGIMSAEGKLEQAQSQDAIKLNLRKLVGKRFFAEIRDGSGDYSDRSEIARVISREEFSARPGPRDVTGTTSAPQTTTPEIGSNGQAATKASAAIDSVLFA